MTSPPVTPPNRRRRRIVVVTIAVLTVVALCSWWNWPRGDARFVGKWALWRLEVDKEKPVAECTFFSNGTLLTVSGGGSHRDRVNWRVDGQSLVLGDESVPVDSVVDRLSDTFYDWTGRYLVYPAIRFDIRHTDKSTIVYRFPEDGELFELHRVPE